MQSETGFPSSHQLKSYVASKSRLKLAARAVLSADAGLLVFTGSIARKVSRRYLIYSEADFEVFRPAGATRCTDGSEIWHEGGDRRRGPC